MKISLAGDLGSGKSTVTDLLLAATGAERYTTGKIMRVLAASRGMSIDEFNRSIEGDPEVDRLIDNGLRALSDDARDLVIDSRMAWYFTRGTFRVYMTTEPVIAAERIMTAGRDGESFKTLDEAVERIAARRASEKKRYYDFYGVDITDLFNYDLVIDTSYAAPAQVASEILNALEAWQEDPSTKRCLICRQLFEHIGIESLKAALKGVIIARRYRSPALPQKFLLAIFLEPFFKQLVVIDDHGLIIIFLDVSAFIQIRQRAHHLRLWRL